MNSNLSSQINMLRQVEYVRGARGKRRFRALSQQAAPSDRERIAALGRKIRRIHPNATGGGRKKALDEVLAEVLHDKYEPRAVVAIRPAFEANRRMEHVLHAVHHDRPRRMVGEANNPLHAQALRALGLLEHGYEGVESRRRDGIG